MLLPCVMQPSPPSPPQQQFVVQHSLFGTPVTKTKDPPRYEEAIKQTRSAQPALPEVSVVTVSPSHISCHPLKNLPQLEQKIPAGNFVFWLAVKTPNPLAYSNFLDQQFSVASGKVFMFPWSPPGSPLMWE